MSNEAMPLIQQNTLFGPAEIHGANPDFPEDVNEALKVIMGTVPGVNMSDPLQEVSRVSPAVLDGKETLQERMLKKTDKVSKNILLSKFKVRTFDLSNDEDAAEYAAVLELVGNPKNKVKIKETQPTTLIDPQAPKGYRVIQTVKWFVLDTVTEVVKLDVGVVSHENQSVRQMTGPVPDKPDFSKAVAPPTKG